MSVLVIILLKNQSRHSEHRKKKKNVEAILAKDENIF
jgi:hypothetical protein